MSQGGGKTTFLTHICQTKKQMGKTSIDQLVYSTPSETENEREKIT